MSFICENERIELLEVIDVFSMMKFLRFYHVENPLRAHHELTPYAFFGTALYAVSQKYPFFSFELTADEDARLSLWVDVAEKNRKKCFDAVVESMHLTEVFYGEIDAKVNGHQLDIVFLGDVLFAEPLKDIIRAVREVGEDESRDHIGTAFAR